MLKTTQHRLDMACKCSIPASMRLPSPIGLVAEPRLPFDTKYRAFVGSRPGHGSLVDADVHRRRLRHGGSAPLEVTGNLGTT